MRVLSIRSTPLVGTDTEQLWYMYRRFCMFPTEYSLSRLYSNRLAMLLYIIPCMFVAVRNLVPPSEASTCADYSITSISRSSIFLRLQYGSPKAWCLRLSSLLLHGYIICAGAEPLPNTLVLNCSASKRAFPRRNHSAMTVSKTRIHEFSEIFLSRSSIGAPRMEYERVWLFASLGLCLMVKKWTLA